MKIALINDTHFGIRNDSIFFLEQSLKYFETQFFPEIEKRGITTIIHLGDFFDRRKYINFNTLKQVRKRFLERIEQKYQFHIIIGNHDTYFRNTNEVNALKELFRGYDNIILYDEPKQVQFKELSVSFIPWINDSNLTEYTNYIAKTNSSVLMGHLEIEGFEVISGVNSPVGIKRNIFDKFEMVLSGHFHIKQSKRNIHYLGTQYQLNFGDAGVIKGFHILDTETRELEFIENTNRLFNVIRYDDTVITEEILEDDFSKLQGTFVKVLVQTKNKPLLFDKFMEKLYNVDTQELTIIDDFGEKQENKSIDITEDTLSIINKEIDLLENDLNKTKLKLTVKDLYMEALTL